MFTGMSLILIFRLKGQSPKGIGVRVIQLLATVVIVPMVGILGLEGVLSGEGAGTILGAIVGYTLGGITAPVPRQDDQESSK
jgi:hypothetical protein